MTYRDKLDKEYKKYILGMGAFLLLLVIGLFLGKYVHPYLAFIMFLSIWPIAISTNAHKSIKCGSCYEALGHCASKGKFPAWTFKISNKLKYCPSCGVQIE